ncbi:MAG: hypothetical protein P8182_10840 [Deltaproteobacteria bacterium]
MKRTFLILALITVFLAPAIVSAQGLLPMRSLPLLGGMFGRTGGGGCGQEAAPGGGVAFGVGYAGDPGGTRISFTVDNAFGQNLINNFRHSFPLQGLWLGLAGKIPFGDQMNVVAYGTWLVPSNERSDEDYDIPNRFPSFRTWRTSVQWYTLGLEAAFTVEGPVAFVGGFRFDSFEVGFSDPEAENFPESGVPILARRYQVRSVSWARKCRRGHQDRELRQRVKWILHGDLCRVRREPYGRRPWGFREMVICPCSGFNRRGRELDRKPYAERLD